MTPEHGNGWFPKLFADGRIVCGITEIFIGPTDAPFSQPSQWISLGPGIGPHAISPDMVLFGQDGDSSNMVTAVPSTGARQILAAPDGTPRVGYNNVVASDVGRWFGNRPGASEAHDEYQGDQLIKAWGPGRWFCGVSPDGTRVLHCDRPNADIKSLFLNETTLVANDIALAEWSISNTALCWREASGAIYGCRQNSTQKESWGFGADGGPQLFDGPDGPWLSTNLGLGDLLIRPVGSKMGYRLPGEFLYYRVRFIDGQIVIVSSSAQGVIQVHTIDPASARVDLTPPPPPIEEPIGPRSAPLPVGTLVDVAAYVGGLEHFPRGVQAKGDTHGMDVQRVPEWERDGSIALWFSKFWEIGPESAELGELLTIDAAPDGDIHMLADATAGKIDDLPVVDVWSKTIFLRKHMRIGRPFGYKSGLMILRKYRRDGTPIDERDWSRETWVEAVYPQYWFGPDIGMKSALVTVHNNTGIEDGQTTDIEGLHTETRVWALGSSWTRWLYDDARVAFATGHFVLPDTHVAQSDFFRTGGTRYAPIIPSWIPLATVPEVPPMSERNLTTAERATIDAFGANFPPPQYPGPGDAPESWQDVNLRHAPNGWVYKLAQQMAFSHGSGWGQKRRGPGAATSNGTIALKDTGTNFHAYDLLESASTGRPKLLGGNGSYYYVDDGQEWLSVPPFNHLGDQKPRPGRAPWPADAMYGVSGFDVAGRVHGGDLSYYNLTAPVPMNNFVYATIDHPQTHRINRTFVEGLAQTESLCKQLAINNRRVMHVMLCGPANRDGVKLTRPQALDMIRQEVAMFLRYPQTVLALTMGNELYQQGFEADFMLDPTFWDEVEALIPLQFPFAIGQVGDAVVFGPGSFAVMHPDRGKGSAEALQILADAQARDGRTVVAREPKRIEAGGTGQASGDLNFVKEELANAKQRNLPYFLHLAAGRGCHVPAMDDVQHQALAMLKAEAATVTPPGPPVPPITPPGSGHPILDCNLSEGASPNHFSHKGYELFVLNKPALVAEAHAWFIRGKGQPMPKEQEAFFVDIRCNRECHVWITPRRAWTDALPGGAP